MTKKKTNKVSGSRTGAPQLRIDRELKALLPPLPQEEIGVLTESLRKDGCLNPIIVWKEKDTIIDGMNRYRICTRHGIPFKVKYLRFSGKEEVKAWIVEHQLGRRNVSTYQKCVLALQFKDYYTQMAKRNLGRPSQGGPRRKRDFTPVNTLAHLAKMACASRSVVWMVDYIQQHGSAAIRRKLEMGKTSIRNAYLQAADLKRKKDRGKGTKIFARYDNPDLKHGIEDTILCGDVLKMMRKIPKGSVSLVLCSPPYNRGHNYGFGSEADRLPHAKYLKWLGRVWLQSARVLRTGGRLVINVDALTSPKDDGADLEKKRCIYADLVQQIRELECGLKFRDEIVWYKSTGSRRRSAYGSYRSCSSPLLRRMSEYVLIWSKDDWRLSNVTGFESDLTAREFELWTRNVWEIHPVTRTRSGHPALYPEELAKRIIKLYTYPGDLVLDPFVGSGTTCAVAARLKRKFCGIDNNPDYCKYSRKRIEEVVRKGKGKG